MTIKSLNTNPASRSFFRSPAAKLGLVSLVALGVAAGCGDDDDDDPADPVTTGGAGGGMMTEGGAGGMMAGGTGGMMAGGTGGMMAGGTGGMMAGGAGGMMAGGAGGMGMGPTGVAYPTGWQDWPVIGIAHREADRDDTSLRIVVGNEAAVGAARDADGKVAEWPPGTILVDAVWGGPGVNPNFADVLAPQTFTTIIVMEKDASYSDTGGWGYAQWLGADQTPQTDAGALQSCYNCHNENVADDDYVFTKPAPVFASTGESGDGLELPADSGDWKLISVHRRINSGQIRLVVGNDTAVADARAGGNTVGNVASWSEGAQLLDRVYIPAAVDDAFPNIIGADALSTNAYMVKDSEAFGGDQNNWGYAAWNMSGTNALDAAALADAPDGADCRGCHQREVPSNDYIFTQPAPLPEGL